jgi:alpha-amylase
VKKQLSRALLFAILLVAAACTPAATPGPAPATLPPGAPTTVRVPPAPTPTAAPTVTPASAPAAPSVPPLAAPVGLDGVLVKGTAGYPWWNDATFYEVFVRSFYDSDADGTGDLPGLIEKLDYLNDGDPATSEDLGVTGLWLMPVSESPSYHGYDVVDYTKIDEEYGTAEDFARLVIEAHKRGIYVIVDLVLNHTSSQHPWFIEAQDPNSPRRDWYVWSETKPEAKNWHEAASGWYYGYFWDGMPDLNLRNPDVTAALQDVARFWLEDMGVDGFRLDAVKHLLEEGKLVEHAPGTFEWLRGFHTFYKGVKPDAFTVGESWADSETVARYAGDKVDVAFEFTLAEAILQSTLNSDRDRVETAQTNIVRFFPPGQFATFLANHDQNRTRSRLFNDEQAKVAASLQLLFEGVPFIYYGEEIGMQGQKPDENIRRPMQWTLEGGFTTGEPWNAYFGDQAERNVEAQSAAADSILSHYRVLLRLRNEHEALRVGDWLPVTVTGENGRVYAAMRSTANETLLVLINLSSKPQPDYRLALSESPLVEGSRPALLFGPAGEVRAPSVDTAGGFEDYAPIDTLPPHATYVIHLAP